MTTTSDADVTAQVDAMAERLLQSFLGAADLFAIYLCDRLGWYRSLADDGPASADELARRTGTHPRYAREWLEQQAASGLLETLSAGAARPDGGLPPQRSQDQGVRRFGLSPAAAEVLADPDSLSYLAPLGRLFAAPAGHLPALLDAYRSGGGVSWAELGVDAREAEADMNRPWYLRRLPGALASVPSLHDALSRTDARVAEIGCGAGWASIALARTYPQATVDAFDVDAPSVEAARGNVAAAQLADRVTVHHVDAEELPEGRFDAVFAFECLHDMPYPSRVLAACRRALADDGVVVVMDEAVGESFTAPADEVERLMYGFSLLVCLPDGMSHPDSAGTGTVMRPATLRRYAREAGFREVDVLPIDDFGLWRFYRLLT
jgi:SAM-dependent methyltransferase